ncbi:MAG: ParB/RepB/Spo0J family partition protein [Bacteroidales bacterium]|nr:ParB/RepB/Spo0J family partition protein [Bacteroidales bacterium]
MKNGQKIDLGLTGYDELFMTEQERHENRLPKIYDIPLSEIDDFPNHPFKVRLDEDMDQLVQSVKDRGVIVPITLRQKEDGRYEIVSGHRRRKACELAGFDTIRAEIKDLTRDEAIILMVESNLQRSVILPSEKAFSYKMRLDAMKRMPGRPSKDNSAPVGQDFSGKTSREIVAESSPDSHSQIQRYIRLTELIPTLLDIVDEGRIGMRPAVELSYLSKEEQSALADAMSYMDATPSHDQAIRMRKMSNEGKLTPEAIEAIMGEVKPNQREKISFRADRLRQYIPKNISPSQTEDYVMKALEHYSRYLEQVKKRNEAR